MDAETKTDDPDALVEGPPVAWVILDDEGDPVLCWGPERGETEGSRLVKLGEIPDHLWEDYESLIEDFEEGYDPDEEAAAGYYARLGDSGRWPR